MSFLLGNTLDRPYIKKLTQEIRILKSSKMDWTIEDVNRFANLIQIDAAVGQTLRAYQIDGAKLFDIEYLSLNLESVINETNFFPLYKMFFVVNAILQLSEEERQKKNEVKQVETNSTNTWVEVEQSVLLRLREELANINHMPIIEIGTGQLFRLLKAANLLQESEYVRRWNIDGFSLICIVANQRENHTIRNYYSDEEIKVLDRLSHIFLHLYYYQHFEQKRPQQPKATQFNLIDDFNIEFNDISFQIGQNLKRSIATSEFGTSEAGRNSEYGTSEVGRNSEYGTSQPGELRNSDYGVSVRGSVRNSQYGVSERGSLKNSEYATSQRGSIRNSMAESMFGNSEINDDQDTYNTTKKDQASLRSSKEEDANLKFLAAAALNLPFNLLNLQPLQRIKISNISYPFSLTRGGLVKKDTKTEDGVVTVATNNDTAKTQNIYDLIDDDEELREFKIFNLSGAKFGRAPENDFSYPDELSISGKHAQIFFKDESYFIRDLGSKTGTFVYISQKKPLVLSEEQVVQLSYEVELKVMIIKNDINEGVIKFEFKKPENEPPYRAILKNNNTVRIGKAEKSHIRLTNQSISSYHAEIKFQEGRFTMYDCNTRTGTWLRLSGKGVRSQDRKLTKHDIIRISSKKTFLIEDITQSVSFHTCCEYTRKCN